MKNLMSFMGFHISLFSVSFALTQKVSIAMIVFGISFVAGIIALQIEKGIKNNGKLWLNRIVYFFTRSDKKYNFKNKRIVYEYKGNNMYELCKEYTIISKTNDLDRIDDRFAWTASSKGCKINPTENKHKINKCRQNERWTYFTIYFDETITKRKPYKIGAQVKNLIDKDNLAEPFTSATIDRKTKVLELVAKIPESEGIREARFSISTGGKMNDREISNTQLTYDESIGGFSVRVEYPRKGWKYVISWN